MRINRIIPRTKNLVGSIRSKVLTGVLVVLVQSAAIAAGLDINDPALDLRVGDYGDVARMTFIGIESFETATLRNALRMEAQLGLKCNGLKMLIIG